MEEHKGSRETYDHIANWIDSEFFFSITDQWGRFGMLGVFGDYILTCTPGAILEIGVGESSIYLTALAKKHRRQIIHCDVSPSKILNPLTIRGYLSTEHTYISTQNDSWSASDCLLFACSSDEMFKKLAVPAIALGFIDGDHIYEQVKKDFYNLLPYVVENGWIILHDTYPPNEDYIDENHCGTVYKLRQEIEKNPDLDCITLTRGCAMDVGLTLVRKKPKARPYFND